jgi:ketosteroid isomerase-like protein
MSQENMEMVRALIPTPETDVAALFRDEGLFQAAREALGDLFDPAFESVARWEAGGTTYAGMEGFSRLWLEWLQPWATYHTHVDDLIDAGDRVVVLARDRGRRHDMEAEVELFAGSVWTVRDAKFVRVEFCSDRAEALEAAGSEQDPHADS